MAVYTEDELRVLHRHYQALAKMSKRDLNLLQSHSIEEAESRHADKREHQKDP